MMSGREREHLTRWAIAKAALHIIDNEGLPALSMRRIGADLGVEAMALYRHYPQKDAILSAVVDMVLGKVEYPRTNDWRVNLRLLSLELRARVLAHPNALPLVAARWLETEGLKGALREASAELRAARLDAHSLLHAVMSLLLGYCWLEVGAFVGSMPEDGGLTRRLVGPRELSSQPSENDAIVGPEQFEKELQMLLAGAGAHTSERV
jgi:AcrR family transcriptional regulator